MTKRIFYLALALNLAAQTSGTTGNCTWTLTGSGSNRTLTIRGNGAMADYTINDLVNTQWADETTAPVALNWQITNATTMRPGYVNTPPTIHNFTWSGAPQVFASLPTDSQNSGVISYYISTSNNSQTGGNWSTTTTTSVGAGTYYVFYKALATTDYYESQVYGPLTLTVSAKSKVAISPSVSMSSYVFGDWNFASNTNCIPKVSGNLGNGEVTYRWYDPKNGGSWSVYSTSYEDYRPMDVRAGYKVQIEIAETTDYLGGSATSGVYSITKLLIKKPTWTPMSFPYTGSEIEVQYPAFISDWAYFEASRSFATNIGTYAIVVELNTGAADKGNIAWADGSTAKFYLYWSIVAPKTTIIEDATDIAEVSAVQLSVYPNPVREELFIKSEMPIKKVEIYTLAGVLLLSENNFNEKIFVSDLPKGVYLLKVYSGSRIAVSKIVKK
jgi:hypothetical protein